MSEHWIDKLNNKDIVELTKMLLLMLLGGFFLGIVVDTYLLR